jgi:hypothetical protein
LGIRFIVCIGDSDVIDTEGIVWRISNAIDLSDLLAQSLPHLVDGVGGVLFFTRSPDTLVIMVLCFSNGVLVENGGNKRNH